MEATNITSNNDAEFLKLDKLLEVIEKEYENEISSLKQELNETKKILSLRESEINNLKAEKNYMMSTVARHQVCHQSAREATVDAFNTIKKLFDNNRTLEKKVIKLEKENLELQSKNMEELKLIKSKQEKIKELEEENSYLARKLKELHIDVVEKENLQADTLNAAIADFHEETLKNIKNRRKKFVKVFCEYIKSVESDVQEFAVNIQKEAVSTKSVVRQVQQQHQEED